MKLFGVKMACVVCGMTSIWTAAIMAEHPELWAVSLILAAWFGRMALLLFRWSEKLEDAPERVQWQKGEGCGR